MPYRGFPYFVAESIGANRSNSPYASERHALPDRRHGVRYTASPRSERRVSPHRPCDTVCPSQAHGARAHTKLAISDVQPLRVLAAVLVMALVALACALAGIGIAHLLTGAVDSALLEEQAPVANAASPANASLSTPPSAWKQGTVPQLYLADTQWSARPYGSSTIGNIGSAPLCLAMVHIDLTGDTATGPIEMASLAQRRGYADHADANALLTDGAAEVGLAAQPVAASELDIRRHVNAGRPLICALKSDDFGGRTTCIVLSGIDERGRLVIVDPSNIERTAQRWGFDDIVQASTGLWAYTLAD
ncbi:papain-like cysteine protease family protein, partial [Gordonibacter sp.]|uniref:papain-like cysteine protease family protein n=1 Tax=Gordonibacter sp. TaxID=1968902 RepID=UPI002FCC3814